MIKEKKKIDFIYVIYKNYSETYKSILSLTDFLRDSGFSINIYISDNSFKEAKEVDIKLITDLINLKLSNTEIKIQYIPLLKNLGFGEGCNIAALISNSPLIIFINSDTSFEISDKDEFKNILSLLDEDNTSIVGPSVYFPNKKISQSCFRFNSISILTKPFAHLINMQDGYDYIFNYPRLQKLIERKKFYNVSLKKRINVDWIAGCFMVVKRSFFNEVGGFDKRFFLYFEDLDLCRRAKEKKQKVIYYKNFKIIHHWNHQSKRTKGLIKPLIVNKTSRLHLISWIRYLIKWKQDFTLGKIIREFKKY